MQAAEQGRDDPGGAYARMTFATRDRYRHVVERIAKRTGRDEAAVAGLARELARAASTDDAQPVALAEEKAFAAEFRQHMNRLNDSQKVIGNKFIHRRCVEKPVQCSACHSVKSIFLPYTDLGYSKDRAAFLVSAEVVDLVQRYETFHMPKLLNPPDQENKGPGDKK